MLGKCVKSNLLRSKNHLCVELQLNLLADLGGRGPPPYSGPDFLYFHVVGRIIGWRSPLGLAPPRLGNSGSATDIIFLTSKPCAATVSGLQNFRRPHQRQQHRIH